MRRARAAVRGLRRARSESFSDRTYHSKVFAGPRHYRFFLPRDYEAPESAIRVIYYFHGHSDRYTLEKYDKGLDTVPKIVELRPES